MMKRFWSLFCIVAVLAIGSKATAQPQPVPQSLSCIPRNIVERVELMAETVYQGRRYSKFEAYNYGSYQSNPLVISQANQASGNCQLEVYNLGGEEMALAEYVPLPVARQFALQYYRREIAHSSLAGMQALINQYAKNEPARWNEEDVWALQQLGITIPSNVQIIPAPANPLRSSN